MNKFVPTKKEEEEVISSHPFFARYKLDPLIYPISLGRSSC